MDKIYNDKKLHELERILGYRFQTKATLVQTCWLPAKQGSPSYEQLAFVGDTVLGFLLNEYMYTMYPTADPAFMSVATELLSSRKGCAKTARRLDLGRFLTEYPTSPHQARPGPPHLTTSSIPASASPTHLHPSGDHLAEMLEGLVGCVYLAGGYWQVKLSFVELINDFYSTYQDEGPAGASPTPDTDLELPADLPLDVYLLGQDLSLHVQEKLRVDCQLYVEGPSLLDEGCVHALYSTYESSPTLYFKRVTYLGALVHKLVVTEWVYLNAMGTSIRQQGYNSTRKSHLSDDRQRCETKKMKCLLGIRLGLVPFLIGAGGRFSRVKDIGKRHLVGDVWCFIVGLVYLSSGLEVARAMCVTYLEQEVSSTAKVQYSNYF